MWSWLEQRNSGMCQSLSMYTVPSIITRGQRSKREWNSIFCSIKRNDELGQKVRCWKRKQSHFLSEITSSACIWLPKQSATKNGQIKKWLYDHEDWNIAFCDKSRALNGFRDKLYQHQRFWSTSKFCNWFKFFKLFVYKL